VSIYNVKIFPGASAESPFKEEGGREGKGRKRGEERGGKGRKGEEHPPNKILRLQQVRS
jgi:hypothetical protein